MVDMFHREKFQLASADKRLDGFYNLLYSDSDPQQLEGPEIILS